MSPFKAFLSFIDAVHAQKQLPTRLPIALSPRVFDALVQDAESLRSAEGTFAVSDEGRLLQIWTPHCEVMVGRVVMGEGRTHAMEIQ